MQGFEELKPIHLRHHEVQENHIGGMDSDQVKGLTTMLGFLDCPLLFLDLATEYLSIDSTIIDNQDEIAPIAAPEAMECE